MDYAALHLKIGLEIHQQLAGNKLFCSCPAEIVDTTADFNVMRQLQASRSELGTVDAAALYEQEKKKFFLYKVYHTTNCLVELDEEPPHAVNFDTLRCALQVAQLLHCSIVDEIQVMRKVVIDGSNVSGFQRTMLVGVSGYLTLSSGKRVGISTLCLEEEAAKKLADTSEFRAYNISRLGIALIEIATAPDLSTPEEAQEAAQIMGMVLRSVAGLRRGLGTIRQDVNVSIKNGARVEIKGFQDLRSIPRVVVYEIERQLALIAQKEVMQPHVRKAEPSLTTSFLRPMPGAARMYPETDVGRIVIDPQLLSSLAIPELLSERIVRYEQTFGLKPDYAREIVQEGIAFEMYFEKFPSLDINFIAHVLVTLPKEIASRFQLDVTRITEEHILSLLDALEHRVISKDAALPLLCDVCSGKMMDFSRYRTLSSVEIEKEITALVRSYKGQPFGLVMGKVMAEFRGKADGKLISELVREHL